MVNDNELSVIVKMAIADSPDYNIPNADAFIATSPLDYAEKQELYKLKERTITELIKHKPINIGTRSETKEQTHRIRNNIRDRYLTKFRTQCTHGIDNSAKNAKLSCTMKFERPCMTNIISKTEMDEIFDYCISQLYIYLCDLEYTVTRSDVKEGNKTLVEFKISWD